MNQEELKDKVHIILAHSYTVYFILLLLGLFLDFIFPFRIFKDFSSGFIGFLFIIAGTFFVYWAQKTSRNLNKENLTKRSFAKGPYRFSRNPTHWGLSLLVLGFGIVSNAAFVVICTIVAFLITKFIFLHREEKILEKKYGGPYLEYKKSVKF